MSEIINSQAPTSQDLYRFINGNDGPTRYFHTLREDRTDGKDYIYALAFAKELVQKKLAEPNLKPDEKQRLTQLNQEYSNIIHNPRIHQDIINNDDAIIAHAKSDMQKFDQFKDVSGQEQALKAHQSWLNIDDNLTVSKIPRTNIVEVTSPQTLEGFAILDIPPQENIETNINPPVVPVNNTDVKPFTQI